MKQIIEVESTVVRITEGYAICRQFSRRFAQNSCVSFNSLEPVRVAQSQKLPTHASFDRMQPMIRIYGDDCDDYAEFRFKTPSDANVAVERLDELFKNATRLSFSASRLRGT